MASPGLRLPSSCRYTLQSTVSVLWQQAISNLNMFEFSSSSFPSFRPLFDIFSHFYLVSGSPSYSCRFLLLSSSPNLENYSLACSMHINPSPPQPPEEETALPSSCYAGNSLSPMSANGQAELDELDADELADLDELDPSSSPQATEPQRTTAAAPRRRRSPTPVELQDTQLRTIITPTRRGGEPSARIHQRRRDREASTQPSAIPSNPPGADAEPSAHIHQRHRGREVSMQPSAIPSNPSGADAAASTHTRRRDREASSHPEVPLADTTLGISSAATNPPAASDQYRYTSQHPGAAFPSSGYPQLPGAAGYPQQLHIPAHIHLRPLNDHNFPSLVPPSAELQHRPTSAPIAADTAPPRPARSSTTVPSSRPLPPVNHVWSPGPSIQPLAQPSLTSSAAATDDDEGLHDRRALSGNDHMFDMFLSELIMAKSQEPDSGDEDLTPPDDEAEDDDNINPFTKPRSPANGSPPPTSSQADGGNIVNASTEPQLSTNDGSPPPSSEASKPKFKVGRRSKEDQEDWNKFTEDVDNMLLKYAKTKNMPMEQVFTQYSTLKKRLNSDSQWNMYQKLWAAQLTGETERAHKHIADLISKGEVIKDVEALSTQALCSYGYAAYKLEYEDDWEERLELHSSLEVASGDPMDYRSRTKAWHKFIDKMKRLCGAAYNSYEFNIAWVAVGSAILNDQGLEESGETDGVKGVWEAKYRCPNGYEKIHLKAHSHHILSTKLLDAESADIDTSTTPLAGNAKAQLSSVVPRIAVGSTSNAQGSPMKVNNAHEEKPTLFGMDADAFNKLSEMNKLRRCWTWCTSNADPTWNEGHQLLWKGRLLKYANRGIRVTSYPHRCLVPGQMLGNPSKGIADTPVDQVKCLLGAFGVPGYIVPEHPIVFEIVGDDIKEDMVANRAPVLIEVPPPVSSTDTHARQHYADGHIDTGGPSRTDIAKSSSKRAVTFSSAEPSVVPPPPASTSETSGPPATAGVKPSLALTSSFNANKKIVASRKTVAPTATSAQPTAHNNKVAAVSRPKIYLQSQNAIADDNDTIIVSSSPEPSTPTPKSNSRKRPLSVDEDARPLYDNDDNDDRKDTEAVDNLFQRGQTVRRGRGKAPTKLDRASGQPKATTKKAKFKSSDIVWDTPSPPFPGPAASTSSTADRPRPIRLSPNAPPSTILKAPSLKLASDAPTKASPKPLAAARPLPTEPPSAASVQSVARQATPKASVDPASRQAPPAPHEASAALRETSVAPREASVAPREVSAAPHKASAAPREASAVPRQASVAPREATSAPRQASVGPTACQASLDPTAQQALGLVAPSNSVPPPARTMQPTSPSTSRQHPLEHQQPPPPSNCHPLNFGYMGPNATTGFPTQYMNHHAPYNTHQPPHQSQPLQEGGGMSRHEGQPLGHQMQMGGGGGGPQQQMQMQMPMGGQQSMGGMPMQWPGGQMYYGSPMAYPPPGYGYPSMMPPQQQPYQYDPAYAAHRQAGDYTTNNHSAPGPEYGHQQ